MASANVALFLSLLAAASFLAGCEDELAPPIARVVVQAEGLVGEAIQVDGTSSQDPEGESLTFTWSFIEAPAGSEAEFNDPALARPSFVPDLPGTYVVGLLVDAGGRTATATGRVEVGVCGSRAPEVSSISADPAEPASGDTVQLTAEITDADNTDESCALDQVLALTWELREKPSESDTELNDPTLRNPTFEADVPGEYVIDLTVIDDTGRRSEVETIRVVAAACGAATPEIDRLAVDPPTPVAGQVVRLSSDVRDADNEGECDAGQTISYEWTLTGRPDESQTVLGESFLPEPNLLVDVPGTYTISLTVTDSTGRESDPQSFSISVEGCGTAPPSVDAAVPSPARPNTGDQVTLAIAVSDPDNDPFNCGLTQRLTVRSSLISRPAGSSATMAPSVGRSPAFTADLAGEYVVRTVVSDDTGLSTSLDTVIEAAACGAAAPAFTSAEADPRFPNVGALVTLTLEAEDRDITSPGCLLDQTLDVTSTFVSVPSGSTATLAPAVGSRPAFTPDLPGGYVVRSTVVDDTGLSDTIETVVVVGTCGANPPFFSSRDVDPEAPNTGDFVAIALGVIDADNLSGGDNCGLSQQLTVTSVLTAQPPFSTAELDPAEGPNIGFQADEPGEYVIASRVDDGTGRSDVLVYTIDVDSCGSATPEFSEITFSPETPAANDVITLDVSVDDPDNDPAGCGLSQDLTIETTFVTRPAGSNAELSTAEGEEPAFIADLPGLYTLRTTATDDTGREAFQDTVIVVSDCGVAVPTITTEDISPDDPGVGSVVTVTVAVDDLDNDPAECNLGQTLTVTSELRSRPAASSAALSTREGLRPTFLADRPGSYVVRSTVTDPAGYSSFIENEIVVSACGTNAPTVDAANVVPADPDTGDAITLELTVSDDDNEASCGLSQVLTIESEFTQRPAGSSATLSTSTGDRPGFVADLPGDYRILSVVSDDTGRTGSLETLVTVSGCGSATPQVDAIAPSPANPNVGSAVTLAISVSDDDNLPGCALDQVLSTSTELINRPAGSTAELSTTAGLTPAFIPDEAGTYRVRTTVEDGTGRTSFLEADIVVAPCGGAQPSVDGITFVPGAPSTGSVVALDIAVSDSDNDPVGCALDQRLDTNTVFTARPAGSSATLVPAAGLSPSFVADLPGDYTVRTTVTDDTGRSSASSATVTVAECGSVAPAIDSVTVSPASPNTGDVVTLDVAASDADNEPACGLAQTLLVTSSFVQRPATSSATLSTSEGVRPSFIADVPGDYVVRTVVTDSTGRSSATETLVTASACGASTPSVDGVVVTPSSPNTGDPVTLAITVSDADNLAGCALSQTLSTSSAFVLRPAGSSATLGTPDGLAPTFVADVTGDYIVRTTVSDGTGRSTFVDTTITASACGAALPSVDAVVVTPSSPGTGDEVSLAISVSDADNLGGCGLSQVLTTSSQIQTRPAGSTATLSTSLGLNPRFVADVPGAYVVRTTVSDDTGRSAIRDTTVVVSTCGSATPSVDGISFSPAAPNTGATVDVLATVSDADNGAGCAAGQTLDTTITLTARPAGSSASIVGSSFVADLPGTYSVRVVVSDGTGRSSSSSANVTVSTCGAATPTFSSIVRTPTSPNVGDTVSFTIVPSDADNLAGCAQGQRLTVTSAFIARPAGSTASLTTPTGTTPAFIPDVPGSYTIRSTVSDDTGRSSFQDSTVSVGGCGIAEPQFDAVSASVDGGTIIAPFAVDTTERIDLSFVVSDLDNVGGCSEGQTLSVSSVLLSQPAGSSATLTPSTGLNTSLRPLVPGSYVVRTTVTDSTGRSARVDTAITANVCGSRSPSAALGVVSPVEVASGTDLILDQPIQPNSTVGFDASDSTDPDDGCLADPPALTYLWTFDEFPATDGPSFNDPTLPAPSFTAAGHGIYVVRVEVSDGFHSDSTTVTFEVSPAADVDVPDGFTVSWVDGAVGPTGLFAAPRGVAMGGLGGTPAGTYVTQSGANRVTRNRSPATTFAQGGLLNTPRDITALSTGGFLVSNAPGGGGSPALVRLSTTGAQSAFAAGATSNVFGLDAFESGVAAQPLVLAGQRGGTLAQLDLAGTVVGSIEFIDGCGLTGTAGVDLGGTDRLFAASNDCDVIFQIDDIGGSHAVGDFFAQVENPLDLAYNADEGLLAVANSGGVTLIEDCGANDGSCAAACIATGFGAVWGVTWADAGTLVVTDQGAGDVFTISGDFGSLLGAGGPDLDTHCSGSPVFGPVVSISGGALAREGNNLIFTVSSDRPTFDDVLVAFAVGDPSDTATTGGLFPDYSVPPLSVTIPAGETSATISIPTLVDGQYDSLTPTETVTVTLTGALGVGATVAPGADVATGEILDEDLPPVVSTSNPADVDEGQPVVLIATLDRPTFEDVEVTLAYGDPGDSARIDDDYTPSPTTLTIVAGTTSGQVDIGTYEDGLYELSESFTITLDAAIGGGASVNAGADTATATIDPSPYVPPAAIDGSALLDDGTGLVVRGGFVGDQLGSSVSAGGDVDGDGIDDLVGGAPFADPNAVDRSGAGYTIFGHAGPFAPIDVSLLDGDGGFRTGGFLARDRAGDSVSLIGDINGDGFDDVAIGAGRADDVGTDRGQVLVVYGSDDGFPGVVDGADLDGSNGFVIDGIFDGSRVGDTVASLGDVNGDGIDDAGFAAGVGDIAFVLFGDSLGFPAVIDINTVGADAGVVFTGADFDGGGSTLMGGGVDVDGDGLNDIIIGSPGSNGGDGGAFVVFGDANLGGLNDLSTLNGGNGFRLDGADAGTGTSVAGAGDVNGDGFGDVIIGATNAGGTGGAYVVFGDNGGFPAAIDLGTLGGSDGSFLAGDGGDAGTAVSGGVDINGDGFDDVIIGAPGTGPGEVFVFYGRSAFSPSHALTSGNGSSVLRIAGADAGDRFGASVATGDFDGDGQPDIIVGAPAADPQGRDAAGEVSVIFGVSNRVTPVVSLRNLGTAIEGNGLTLTVTVEPPAFEDITVNVSYGAVGDTARLTDDYVPDATQVVIPAETASATLTVSTVSDDIFEIGETFSVSIDSVSGGDAVANPGSASGRIVDPDPIPRSATLDLDTLGSDEAYILEGTSDVNLLGVSQDGGGDFNGDGLDDLLVTSPSAPIGGSGVGAGYVVFGDESLGGRQNANSLDGSNGFRTQLASDSSGMAAIRNAGDLNGDGFDDVVFARRQPTGTNGQAFVVFGGAAGFPSVIDGSTLNGSNGFRVDNDLPAADLFDDVVGLGDVNGDGYDDFGLADELGSGAAGRVIVVLGSGDGFPAVVAASSLSGADGFVIGSTPGPGFGVGLAGVGDVNGDDFDDIGVCDPGNCWVILGRSAFAPLVDPDLLTGADGFRLDNSRSSIGGGQDFDGDGIDDFIAGRVPRAGVLGVSVVYGSTSGFPAVIDVAALPASDALFIEPNASFSAATDTFGFGDVNGDGLADAVVGMVPHSGFADDVAAVVFGGANLSSPVLVESLDGTDGFIAPWSPDDFSRADGSPDLNGDGIGELLVADFSASPGGRVAAGEAWVVFGEASTPRPLVSLLEAPHTNEGGTATYTVLIDPVTFEDVEVELDFGAPGDTASPGEYTPPVSTTVTIPAETASVTFDVAHGSDSEDERGERYTVSIASVSGGHAVINPRPATGTIVDTTPAPVVSIADATADDEGEDQVFTVSLDRVTYSDVVVTFGYGGGGDTADLIDDYVAVATVTIPAGSTSTTLDVQTVVDGVHEAASETFTVTIVDTFGAFSTIGASATATGTINDIDPAPQVSVAAVAPVIEGANSAFQVSITTPADEDITVTYTATDGTATSGGLNPDYVQPSGSVVIPALTTSENVFVSTLSDGIFEVNESFTLTLTNTSGGDSTLSGSVVDTGVIVDAGIALPPATVSTGTLDGDNGSTFGSSFADGGNRGASVSVGGDFDNDGLADVIIGAPKAQFGSIFPGSAFLLFGSEERFDASLEIEQVAAGSLRGTAFRGFEDGSDTGFSVASAGDVNGDGFDDLIISSPERPAGTNSGRAYVYYGHGPTFPDSFDLETLTALGGGTGATGFTINGAAIGDNAGESVAGIGDVNGDGIDDLVVGALAAGPSSRGAAFVVFGRFGGFGPELDLVDLTSGGGGDGSQGFVLRGIDNSDNAGEAVSAAGDVNGDGIGDLLVGAQSAETSVNAQGETYLVFGRDTGFPAELNLSTLAGGGGTQGVVFVGIDDGDNAGVSVARGGDVNGDGFDDIIIGAENGDPNSSQNGETYVVFGRASFSSGSFALASLEFGGGVEGAVLNGINSGDNSGRAVAGGGDINGDGFDDIVIGAPNAEPAGGSGEGEVYVYYGRPSFAAETELSSLISGDGTQGFVIFGDAPGANIGFDVATGGDIDGDGFDDIVIGAPSAGVGGEFYVYYGGPSATVPVVTISDAPAVVEGGTSTFVVHVDPPAYEDIDVTLAVNPDGTDSAVAGADFTAPSLSVTIPAETATATVSVTTLDDGIHEVRETMTLGVVGVSGASAIFGSSPAELQILNDPADTPPAVALGPDQSAEEGSPNCPEVPCAANDLTFTVSIDIEAYADVVVDLVIGGEPGDTATQTSDFTPTSTTVTIPAGSLSTTFDVALVLDGLDEADSEDFTVVIDAVRGANATIDPGASTAIGTIFDVDVPVPPSTVNLSALLGSEADFFSGRRGAEVVGSGANRRFGVTVSSAGDFNGDGLEDFTASEWGRAWVRYGRSTPFLASESLDDHSSSTGLLISLAVQTVGGERIAGGGDINGDGFDDLVMGVPVANRIYVIYGSASPPVTLDLSAGLTPSQGYIIDDDLGSTALGTSVAVVGDVNRDGLADFMFSSNSNRTFLVYGSRTNPAPGLTSEIGPGNIPGIFFTGLQGRVSGLGDLNGDGFAEFGLGVTTSSRQYVGYGGASLPDIYGIADFLFFGFWLETVPGGTSLGQSAAALGDVTGDGIDDFAVGAPLYTPSSPSRSNAGAVWVVPGGQGLGGGNTLPSGLIANTLFIGPSSNSMLGGAIGGGDFDGNGLGDLIALGQTGWALYDTAYDEGNVVDLAALPSSDGFSLVLGATTSVTSSGAGSADLNGDGYADFLVGASLSTSGGNPTGSTFLIFGADAKSRVDELGTSGADTLTIGTFGVDDMADGLAGDDDITGSVNDDSLIGGRDDDTLDGAAGDDNLSGGGGFDTASYLLAPSAVSIDLRIGEWQDTVGAGVDRLYSIEHLTGSPAGDTLRGNGYANTISGGGGPDFLFGEGGDDALFGDAGPDELRGGLDDDYLDGGPGADVIYAETGNDEMHLGADSSTDAVVYEGGSFDGLDEVFDFDTGDDLIDLVDLLDADFPSYMPGTSDPDEYVLVTDDGTDTTIAIDPDGIGGPNPPVDLLIVRGVVMGPASDMVTGGQLLLDPTP